MKILYLKPTIRDDTALENTIDTTRIGYHTNAIFNHYNNFTTKVITNKRGSCKILCQHNYTRQVSAFETRYNRGGSSGRIGQACFFK